MATMKEIPAGEYPLRLGQSMDGGDSSDDETSTFHTIRYDFKPSVSNENGYIALGDKKDVTIAVPRMDEQSGKVKDINVFRGSVKPTQEKECLLLYNGETGEFILEQLASQMTVKNTRNDSSKQALVEQVKQLKASAEQGDEELSSDDDLEEPDGSDDSDDSNKEDEEESVEKVQPAKSPEPVKPVKKETPVSQLHEDLRLSDSSDED